MVRVVINRNSLNWCTLRHLKHRVYGPAFEWFNGTVCWWFDDKKHRYPGPAVEWSDGRVEHWVNGVRVDG